MKTYRRASELDVGSRVVLHGNVLAVTRVYDHFHSYGAFTGILFDNGCAIIDRASTLYETV